MIKVTFENQLSYSITENLVLIFQTDFKTGRPIKDLSKVPLRLGPNRKITINLPENHVLANSERVVYYLDKDKIQRRRQVFRKNWKSPLKDKFPVTKFVNCCHKSLGLQDEYEIVGIPCPPHLTFEKHLNPRSRWAKYSKVEIGMVKHHGVKWDEKEVLMVGVKKKKLRPKAELEMLKKMCEGEAKIQGEMKIAQRPLQIVSVK